MTTTAIAAESTKDHTFPIRKRPVRLKGATSDADAFITRMRRKELAGVPAQAVALIERLQPYNTPDPSHYFLTVLNEMARDDRHRTLLGWHVSGDPAAIRRLFVPYSGARITGFRTLLREGQSLLKDGTKVARLRIEPLSRKAKVDVKGDLPADIAFGNRGQRIPLISLYEINREVRKLIRLFQQFV